jgi:hypothetical protein
LIENNSPAILFTIRVSFETDRVAVDSKTGKPVADVTRYIYHDADAHYVVSFEREETILQAIFTDRMPLLKRIVARLISFDGAYQRFTSKVPPSRSSRGTCAWSVSMTAPFGN